MKRKRVWRIVSVALIVVWAVVIFFVFRTAGYGVFGNQRACELPDC